MEQPLCPRRWSRRAVVVLGFVLAGGVGLLVLGVSSAISPAPEVRLPDGMVLTLEALTWGRTGAVAGTPWQRFLYAVLPDPLKDRSGARRFPGVPDGNLTYWITFRHGDPSSGRLWRGVPVDAHGCVGTPMDGSEPADVEVPVPSVGVPLRTGIVGLRVYTQSQTDEEWTLAGELHLPNPAPRDLPQWSASPLPATGGMGPVRFTLTAFHPVAKPGWLEKSPGPGQVYWLAEYRLTENGHPPKTWAASVDGFRDATGNQFRVDPVYATVRPDGTTRFLFPAPLSRDEAAFRLHVTLRRHLRRDRDYSTSLELLIPHGVPQAPPSER